MQIQFYSQLFILKKDYGFDYSDDDAGNDEDDTNIDVENLYYTAKCLLLSC